jgi:hypothetical protein
VYPTLVYSASAAKVVFIDALDTGVSSVAGVRTVSATKNAAAPTIILLDVPRVYDIYFTSFSKNRY